MFKATKQQKDILGAVLKGDDHLRVIARAGTGKTSTMEWIAGEMPEARRRRLGCIAFGKAIADELARRLPDVYCGTSHSFGLRTIFKHYGGRNVKINNGKLTLMYKEMYGDQRGKMAQVYWDRLGSVRKLVDLAKANLVESKEEIRDLAVRYGETGNVGDSLDVIVDDVVKLLRESVGYRDGQGKYLVDFTDMIWLPVKLGMLPFKTFEDLMIDEAQDLNPCQHSLLMSLGRRSVVVGDPEQSIFAFRGADCDSMENARRYLEGRGSVRDLPLAISFRCPQDVIRMAQEIVPDIQARPRAPKGVVCEMGVEDWKPEEMEAGDLVVCRTNAPIVGLFFQMVKTGKGVGIVGRDMSGEFHKIVKDVGGFGCRFNDGFYEMLDAWVDAKREDMQEKGCKESAIANLEDRADCVRLIIENTGVRGEQEFKEACEDMFPASMEGLVRLSTVHRAKGLEAPRVCIYRSELIPFPYADKDWEQKQEMNLKYVAITRAKERLDVVRGD